MSFIGSLTLPSARMAKTFQTLLIRRCFQLLFILLTVASCCKSPASRMPTKQSPNVTPLCQHAGSTFYTDINLVLFLRCGTTTPDSTFVSFICNSEVQYRHNITMQSRLWKRGYWFLLCLSHRIWTLHSPAVFLCYWNVSNCLLLKVSEAKDTITFWLSSSLDRKASSPKGSLRTKQKDESRQRKSPSSPSQGKYHHVIHNGFLSTY